MRKCKQTSNGLVLKLKRMVSLKDNRIKEKDRTTKPKKDDPAAISVREQPQQSSALFFSYNTQLGPPYHIILGTEPLTMFM